MNLFWIVLHEKSKNKLVYKVHLSDRWYNVVVLVRLYFGLRTLISFIPATDFVGRNEGMQTKATRLSLFGNQSDNDSLSSYKII